MTDASFQAWKESGGRDLCKSAQSHSRSTDLLESTELRAAAAARVNLGIFVRWEYNTRTLDKSQLAERSGREIRSSPKTQQRERPTARPSSKHQYLPLTAAGPLLKQDGQRNDPKRPQRSSKGKLLGVRPRRCSEIRNLQSTVCLALQLNQKQPYTKSQEKNWLFQSLPR